MSAIQDAIVAFADTVLQHFPPYKWDETKESAWADTLVRELSGFSVQVIERAAQEIVRTRKKTQTPLVAECIDACLSARRWVEAIERATTLPLGQDSSVPNNDWTTERKTLAWQLACNRRDPMCKEAARDGWIGTLYEFARTNSRMPEAAKRIAYRKTKHAAEEMISEIEWCKRTAKDVDAAGALSMRRVGYGPLAEKFEAWFTAILERRKQKENWVLNGVMPQ